MQVIDNIKSFIVDMLKPSEPYVIGYAAYSAGLALEDNPFDEPEQQRQWDSGWLDAESEE